jgi:hypothetical protein
VPLANCSIRCCCNRRNNDQPSAMATSGRFRNGCLRTSADEWRLQSERRSRILIQFEAAASASCPNSNRQHSSCPGNTRRRTRFLLGQGDDVLLPLASPVYLCPTCSLRSRDPRACCRRQADKRLRAFALCRKIPIRAASPPSSCSTTELTMKRLCHPQVETLALASPLP